MTLQKGQVLQDRYRVIEPLGEGGMGAVYKAWDARLELFVAVKELVPQPGLDARALDQLRRQFRREATVLARLDHPHLVRVTDFFEEGGNVYLVMNLVEGESLAERIAREGPLPEAEVLIWAGQLLDALAYCHRAGVVHRDVKPQNVILQQDGRAVLVDFGLVKLWDPQDPRTRTAIWGATMEYAPPEQLGLGGGHTDPRSDLYSLGATLYHALTGQAPPMATERVAEPERFVPPRAVVPGIGKRTEAAVVKALSLPMAERFHSADEMAQALGVATGEAPAGRARRRKGFRAWGWAAGALIVLGVVAGAVLGTGGRGGRGTPTPSSEAGATSPAVPAETRGSPTPSATVTVVLLPTATATSTGTPTPSPTATRTPTFTPSPTLTPTVTPRPTVTPIPPTATPTRLPPTATPVPPPTQPPPPPPTQPPPPPTQPPPPPISTPPPPVEPTSTPPPP